MGEASVLNEVHRELEDLLAERSGCLCSIRFTISSSAMAHDGLYTLVQLHPIKPVACELEKLS